MTKRGGFVLAGGHVILPAMPGAGDDTAIKLALSQWPSLVRTDSVHRVIIPVNTVKGDHATCNDQFLGASGRALFYGGKVVPFTGHVGIPW